MEKIFKSIPVTYFNDNINALEKKIGRITLHISNDCNLKCTYCYANGGNYNQEKKLMSQQTAIDFVKFFTKRFEKIGSIVFFGGEPLMNYNIIETVCNEFEKLKAIGKIDYTPTFGIITNGTILNEKILEIIKKHISFITVSIDGPEFINDINRKFENGAGSHCKIEKFINCIQSETNAKIRYEATITKEHKLHNITEANVVDYLRNTFQIEGSSAPDIVYDMEKNYLSDESRINIIENDTVVYLSEGFINILSAIVHNIFREMCPIGHNIIAVSVDGEIYPCHMNVGKEHLKIGTIYEQNIFDNPEIFITKFPYLQSIFKKKEPCINCWAQKICGGCAIRWFFDYAEDKYNNVPNTKMCEQNKKYIETIILEIVKIKKNKEKWNEFINYLKSNNTISCNYRDGH